MKAKRLADLASRVINEAMVWSGSIPPEEGEEYRLHCVELKRVLRNVILNTPPHVIKNATNYLEVLT